MFLQSKHITSKDVSLINTVRNIIFYLSVKNFFTEESLADWEISSVELLCKNLSVTWMNERPMEILRTINNYDKLGTWE